MDVEEVGREDAYCRRCYGIPELEVTFGDGSVVCLCAICDEYGSASADALLRFRVMYPAPSVDLANLYAQLIRDWLEDVRPPSITDDELADVLRRWSRRPLGEQRP
jgi:hypothetical protein